MTASPPKSRWKAALIAVAALVVVAAAVGAGYLMGRSSHPSGPVVHRTGLKVLHLGVDGAEWSVIRPLMAEGKLPNFARLINQGASGDLTTIKPILSPIIWTTIVTGKTPDKHGITYFLVQDPENGRQLPVQSDMRQCKAIWNILSDLGMSVGVIGWWATFPAERVNGFVVTDYMAYHAFGLTGKDVKTSVGKTFPPSLYDRVAPYFKDPLSIPKKELDRFMPLTDQEYDYSVKQPFDFGNPLHHFMWALSTAKAYRAMGLDLYKQYRPDWMGIYFEQVDSISHIFMKYAPPKMEGMDDKYYEKYKDVVNNYYIYQDEIIGDFLAEAGPNTVVIINSDHGFKTGDRRLKEDEGTSIAKAALWHEEHGVIILCGPAIRKGVTITGASVMDITPTILYLLGAPVARDMDGKVLLDAVTDEFREARPVQYIDTYETGKPEEKKQPVAADSAIDSEVKARLQALGYIGPGLNDDIVRQGRVQAHLEKGDVAGAKKEVEALLQKDPNDLTARFTMGRILEQEGNAKEAEEYYRKIADQAGADIKPEEKPMYAQALQAVALDDHLAGKTDQAISELTHSLELNPGNPEGEYNLGVMFESRQQYTDAITRYEKAVGLDPNLALAHNNLGNCYQKVGEIQKAIAEYQKTAEVDPKHVECHYNLGVLYQLIGRGDDAGKEFEAALAINPDFSQASAALGELSIQRADYARAVTIFSGLVQKDPSNPANLFLYAKALAMKGDLKLARENIKKARAIDPAGVSQALGRDPALSKLLGHPSP